MGENEKMRHNSRVVKDILSMLQDQGCLKEPLQSFSEPKSHTSALAPACASISALSSASATYNPAHNIFPVTFTLNMRTDVKHEAALLMSDMRRQSLTFNSNSDPSAQRSHTKGQSTLILPMCIFIFAHTASLS